MSTHLFPFKQEHYIVLHVNTLKPAAMIQLHFIETLEKQPFLTGVLAEIIGFGVFAKTLFWLLGLVFVWAFGRLIWEVLFGVWEHCLVDQTICCMGYLTKVDC